MRPIERLDEISDLILKIWRYDPDQRYMQLVYNLQREYSYRNNGKGAIKEVESDGFTRTGYDLFNTEDTDIQEFLKLYLNELQNKSA